MKTNQPNLPNDAKRLTKLKQIKKKQKPNFRAQNSWRFKRVDSRWRRPRGIDSKMREKLKGHPRMVNIGFRSSKLLRDRYYSEKRGLLEEFIISNMSDLELVLPHRHVVRIDGNLGLRKKEKLYQEAVSWGLYVINPLKSKEDFDETDLPKSETKRALDEIGKNKFAALGYKDIGMDHFDLPHDSLYKALENKTLHRNFMGYTSGKTDVMIGLGMSSISDSWYAFAQHVKTVE